MAEGEDGAEAYQLQAGDRMLIPCQGGPSTSRLQRFPPALEIEESGGTYVLVDDGSQHQWSYVWVPAG